MASKFPTNKAWDTIAKSFAAQASSATHPFPDPATAFTPAIKPMTLPVAAMLTHLDELSPLSTATLILDTGCGPGTVFRALLHPDAAFLKLGPSARLLASDFSHGFVNEVLSTRDAEIAKDGASSCPWARVDARVIDAQDLSSIDDASVSHATASFVTPLLPDPGAGLREVHRVLSANGGVFSVSSWKDAEWIHAMAAVPGLNDMLTPEWRSKEGVAEQLVQAGFRDVEVREVETGMGFENVDKLVDTFWGMPHLQAGWARVQGADEGEVKKEMRMRVVECAGEGPGVLRGVALVGWGRK